jgi:hypothetical protein
MIKLVYLIKPKPMKKLILISVLVSLSGFGQKYHQKVKFNKKVKKQKTLVKCSLQRFFLLPKVVYSRTNSGMN